MLSTKPDQAKPVLIESKLICWKFQLGTIPVYPADEGFYENISQQHFPTLSHFGSNLPKSSVNQPAALCLHFKFYS